MKLYKVLWSESKLDRSENPRLLKDMEQCDLLDELIAGIEDGSRFDRYTETTKWFYLNGLKLERKDPTGNRYTPGINFAPCYFETSSKLRDTIQKAVKNKSEIKDHYSRLKRKIRENKRLPITAVIECCEILDTDFWELVEGERLGGKTSSETITLPKESARLDKLAAWILTEGHIPLSHPSIEINQVEPEAESLVKLAQDFQEIFDSGSITHFSSTESWSDVNGERLIISSSAVRQFFVLKYGIRPGKKSRIIDWNITVSEENYRELLNCFIKTEGCLSNSGDQARFEFKIQDEEIRDACERCLREIGCHPQSSETETFNTGIYSIEDILRLYHFVKNELDGKTLLKVEEIIQNPRALYQIKKEEWGKYVDEARNQLSKNRPNQKFTELHNQLFSEIEVINHARVSTWATGESKTPLSAALLAIQILDKDPEYILKDHVQSYISSILPIGTCRT